MYGGLNGLCRRRSNSFDGAKPNDDMGCRSIFNLGQLPQCVPNALEKIGDSL